MSDRYPVEVLSAYADDGTMLDNVTTLRDAVVGRRIVSTHNERVLRYPNHPTWGTEEAFVITLDDGRRVVLRDTDDCCAYTELKEFFLHPESVDHIILGVGTTDGYQTWHIYADFGDIMRLKVGWSAGNPFYYGYGFNIRVEDIA